MSENEIISQLRNMRRFQRDQLYSTLYPAYVENRTTALKKISEQCGVAEETMNELYVEWSHLQSKWFSKSAQDEVAAEHRTAKKEFESIRRTKENILNTYENTCEFNVKLKEFDIETERIVLAHLCNVELICGKQMLISESTR